VQIVARNTAIRRLVQASSAVDIADALESALAVTNMHALLQDVDLVRLKSCVYRDMEEQRQAQFLALAVTYFLSVLMVSRYRDILEPPASPSPFFDSTKQTGAQKPATGELHGYALFTSFFPDTKYLDSNDLASKQSDGNASDEQLNKSHETPPATKVDEDGEQTTQTHTSSTAASISAIAVTSEVPAATTDKDAYKPEALTRLQQQTTSASALRERQTQLSRELQQALTQCAPLLREIITDFRSFLQRTLLGTHAQEIMNDTRVMSTLLGTGSVIELVMLLCSQEWQTSLQKHAGLAFIELVNEGMNAHTHMRL
jgi:hypothetical protein